jgi:hypothetical protein
MTVGTKEHELSKIKNNYLCLGKFYGLEESPLCLGFLCLYSIVSVGKAGLGNVSRCWRPR